MTRMSWRALSLVVALFAAGTALGLALGHWAWAAPRHRDFGGRAGLEAGPARGRDGRPGGMPPSAMMVRRLSRELDLTPAQQDSIRAILERHRTAVDSLWREFSPRFRGLQQQIHGEIETQLTPGQRTRFEQLTARVMRYRRGGPEGREPRRRGEADSEARRPPPPAP
ncbi:MAG TPA: hypothetical protein VFS40_04965 [Gemmatimonadales bacterium]|nr:hypothetical protein [Gemmatimonadales bacterium]